MQQVTKVWDLAVRFFHWSQLLLIGGLWYTGEQGLMAQHQLLAYTLLALVIARLIWGFAGSQNARFSDFAATPAQAWRYLRQPVPIAGHNPASFYMILLLILLVIVQLVSGLATFDNSYLSDGPLVASLPQAWVDLASEVHSINIDILLGAIALHIVAAIWHSIRVHNVIKLMFTGKESAQSEGKAFKHSGWFFLLFTVLLIVFYSWQGASLMALG